MKLKCLQLEKSWYQMANLKQKHAEISKSRSYVLMINDFLIPVCKMVNFLATDQTWDEIVVIFNEWVNKYKF